MSLSPKPEIQAEMRSLANSGASVVEIAQHLRRALGVDGPGQGWIIVITYMAKTFDIPLLKASAFGTWVGLGYNDGWMTDVDLQRAFGHFV